MLQNLRKIAVAVLLGVSLFGGFASVQAQTPGDRQARCEQRIRRAEANLQRAIRRHGANSPQAEHRRQQLAEVRARCGRQL